MNILCIDLFLNMDLMYTPTNVELLFFCCVEKIYPFCKIVYEVVSLFMYFSTSGGYK